MTPQENQALQDFLNQLIQAGGISKDPQAEVLIARAVTQQPDAAYLLVQRAMLLEQALNQSKAQVAHLQDALQTARTSNTTRFLDAGSTWGHSAVESLRAPVSTAPASLTQNPVSMPSPVATVTRPGFFGGNTGNFLTNVAATAAGVAGGAFLFQGIENLMGHHSQGSGLPGQSGLTGAPIEQAAINNYHAADTPAADADNGNSDDFTSLDFDDSSNGGDGLTSI